ncbi:MAG: hypothetical protein ACKV2T_35715 [Kofleriaceae bacterium]
MTFLGLSIWIWIAILIVVGLIAFFTVSPASPDGTPGAEDPAEPPPGSAP